MKRYCLLLVACLFVAFASKAQDVITLTNGNQVQAKVLEINPTQITYKDFNNQDGPTITIMKAGVVSIVYANGTKTLFSSSSDKPASASFTRSNSSGHYDHNNHGYTRRPGRGSDIKGWYFGIELNLGIGSATSNDPTYSTSSGNYSGVNVLGTYMFSQHLGIQFGLGFDGIDYNVNYNPTSNNVLEYGIYNDDYSLSYLTIPVKALYFSNSKGKVGFYASAGIGLSFMMGIASDEEHDNLNPYFAPVVVSPTISCGVDLRTRRGGIWMFGPFYTTSVTNVYSGNAYQDWMNSGNTGNFSSFGLAINYMAKLGR